jgi:SAM-dependent methyltransferase
MGNDRQLSPSVDALEAAPRGEKRLGHAVLDLDSRSAKARKVDELLRLEPTRRTLRVLEVGTGAGGIAHYFATHPTLSCDVDAVDVEDHRQVCAGYRFAVVRDVRLPFGDRTFDVVISNHVIEHVGDESAQRLHLCELRRVLKDDGVGYLAMPNRWQVTEPHYRLAFLSWLPPAWRTPYLKMMKRGNVYDCRPLAARELEAHMTAAKFSFVQQHGRALRLVFELERPHALAYRAFIRWLPVGAFAPLRGLFPTLIYVLRARTE